MQPKDKKNNKLMQDRDERIRNNKLNQLVNSKGVLGNNPNYNSSIIELSSEKPANRVSITGPDFSKEMDSVTPKKNELVDEHPTTTENSHSVLNLSHS